MLCMLCMLCYVMLCMLCMLCYVISLASPVTEQWIINKCLIGRGATTAVSQIQWSQSSHAPEDDAGFARKSREEDLLSYRFRALDTDTRIYEFPTSVLAAQEMEELKSSLWLHRWGTSMWSRHIREYCVSMPFFITQNIDYVYICLQ